MIDKQQIFVNYYMSLTETSQDYAIEVRCKLTEAQRAMPFHSALTYSSNHPESR